jgi:hypothetical protein
MLARALLASKSTQPAYIEDVFSTWLYTGNGSTQTINNGIDLATKGGLTIFKGRSGATDWAVYDTTRGATFDLATNTTAAQTTQSTGLTAFNANGFSIGALAKINTNAATYASWTFAKQAKFFDIQTFTTNASGGATVSHALGSTPGCVIIKSTGTTQNWFVYHRGLTIPNDYMINLNTTAAEQNQGAAVWSASSSAFTINNGTLSNSTAYVAYFFAHNAGGFGLTGTDNVISCGSYTGTGASGNAINLGYEPQWLLVKRATGSAEPWLLSDTMRELSMTTSRSLRPNSSDAEVNDGIFQPSSTGFVVNFGSGNSNASGETYIYIAIRRGPMRVPTSGTQVYNAETLGQTSGGTSPGFRSGWPVDLIHVYGRSGAGDHNFADRLRGETVFYTNLTNAETSNATFKWGYMNGAYDSASTSTNLIGHLFRRAPGFFDVVCDTGTGSTHTITHNLGAVPELMIRKSRSQAATSWYCYVASEGASRRGFLNNDSAWGGPDNSIWGGTTPTSTVFTVGADGNVNNNTSTYVTCLFATCPGVSKVGSYTGTGSTLQVNCGFAAGARFVLIKATSTTGDWLVWDVARGLVAGNDPYLALNSTAAEVTTTDWVDPQSAGFELSNASGNLANTNGVSYIFFAVA